MLAHPAIDRACADVVARADQHYAEAEAIMVRAPRRAVRAPRMMGAAYRAILVATNAQGWRPPRRRVSLSTPQKLGILLRYAIV